MIENLKGIHETVNYKENTNLRLYDNDENESYPNHWHTPIEIIMPTDNIYTVCVGKNKTILNVGDIILICPGVIHSLEAPEQGKRIIFQAELSTLYHIKELESILSLISPAITITPENSPSIHSKIQEMLLQIDKEYNEGDTLSDASILASLLNIFVLIGRNYTCNDSRFDVGVQKRKEYLEKFISICNYINEHCTDNLTLEEVAEKAGFSKYHFTRLFKQFTDITFYKYLNQKRIAYAERMLADPEISITEVALLSGYTSISAFIRMFKLVKQCTPSEFRNMYTN